MDGPPPPIATAKKLDKEPGKETGSPALVANTNPALSGAMGCCPRCGKGAVFRRGLVLRDRCAVCDLDFRFIDTGDGPAVFAIFILGFVVLGLALIAEFKFGAPVWFHVIAWGLLTPLLAIAILRGLKGLLIGLQYRNKAEQGQLAPPVIKRS